MYFIDESSLAKGTGQQKDFYADDVSDLQNLPTHSSIGVQQGDDNISNQKVGYGSSCLVISSGELYILNSQDEWKKV